jgi:hypothetical protein
MADKITGFLFGTVYGGIICILVGAFALYKFYNEKTPDYEESVFFPKWKGILGALVLVLGGIGIIIWKVFYPEVE